MRKQSSSFRVLKTVAIMVLVLLVIGSGFAASLWAAGVPMDRLAFWKSDTESEVDAISLPMNWKPIVAYSKVTRGDLIDPKTGAIPSVKIPLTSVSGMAATVSGGDQGLVEKRVTKAERTESGILLQLEDGTVINERQLIKLGGAFTQATDVIGRVVKSDKSPGFAFAESNFFEVGTPSGLAGATPPGMRAMTLEAAQLAGVHRISRGEQIDLVANIPLQKLNRFEYATGSQLPGSELVIDPSRANRDQEKETTARLVARQAIVLTPVVRRVSTETSASLSEGKRLLSVPIEEVVLAVAAEDVSSVTAALELGATVNVLVRSGRVDAEQTRPAVEDGMVAIPIPGQTLLAYRAIRTPAFEDPATGFVRTIQVPQETAASSGWITDLSQMVGRLPRHDLPSTVPISETDLMPAGSAAGLSGATPTGRVLFFLDPEDLVGGDAFEFGQRLDLVASRTEEASRRAGSGTYTNVSLSDAQRTRVEPIADDVVVVMPVRSPGNPTADTNAKDPKDTSAKLIIAVRPDQVSRLEYAVAVGSNLRATVRSANSIPRDVPMADSPDDSTDQVTVMRFDPLSDAKRTDIFVGGSQQAQLFGVER
ncbi:MAG: hypothetical protein AAFV88_10990 [Planctomycetota bacterium]